MLDACTLLEGIMHACILLEGMLGACMLLEDMLDALMLLEAMLVMFSIGPRLQFLQYTVLPVSFLQMTSPAGISETSLTGLAGGTEVEDGGVGWLTSKSLLGQGSPGLLT